MKRTLLKETNPAFNNFFYCDSSLSSQEGNRYYISANCNARMVLQISPVSKVTEAGRDNKDNHPNVRHY